MDLKIKTETEEFHGRTCGIIKQENKFLIMRVNKTSYFHIPGGHIEIGEDSKEAVIREIKEEIGCDVQEANFFVIQENFWIRNNRKCHGIEFYYIIKPKQQLQIKDYEKIENDKSITLKVNDGNAAGATIKLQLIVDDNVVAEKDISIIVGF